MAQGSGVTTAEQCILRDWKKHERNPVTHKISSFPAADSIVAAVWFQSSDLPPSALNLPPNPCEQGLFEHGNRR